MSQQLQQNPPVSPDVAWARDVIAGRISVGTSGEALKRSRALKAENRFDLARRVLGMVHPPAGDSGYLEVHQQIANCTYKDEDVPMPHRFHAALDILRKNCDLDRTDDPETLSLGGAVYKRLWQYNGQREPLERSLACYHKAYRQKPDDNGYAAINSAFILDVLAWQESTSVDGIPPEAPQQRHAEARRIREELIAQWTPGPAEPSWWLCASVAEAYFGIGEFEQAVQWLARGAKTSDRWERESTVRQLALLTRVHCARHGDDYRAAAESALERGLGISQQAVRSVLLGKVGLALSGGGFRASLYHIGVLAKLAELDVLRHVEVISCVSGGSIIGAYYYLELKKRLEQSASLTQDDYIDLVQTVEREFLRGVQANIRTRLASSLFASLKMAVWPGYTRTSRAGELYEEYLYQRVDGVKRRSLPSLLIQPGGQPANPRYDNWSRDSKVPILVLNATTLNTGHNWQFTATWMGESPQAINGAIDAIPRMRRLYINGRDENIPKQFLGFPLGQAVGASAAVPGLFAPIELRGLYPDRAVRLSDGGVHDNQGLSSLIEEWCNVLLVSDASGQMQEAKNPSAGALAVTQQTNEILQARIREAQFTQLQTLQSSGAIDGAMFIHLTKELDADAISYVNAKDVDEVKRNPPQLTRYGVDRDIQLQLASVRTDLDSFSDAEAYALMTSGYLMTEHALLVEKCAPTLPLHQKLAQWRFLRVHRALSVPGSEDNLRMRRLLKHSNKLPGKVWRQLRSLQIAAVVAIAGGIGALVINWQAALSVWNDVKAYRLPTLGTIMAGAGILAAIVAARYAADKLLHLQKRLSEFVLGITLATAGLAASWLHLIFFDQLYLWNGRWDEPATPPSGNPAIAHPSSPRLSIQAATASPPVKPARTPLVRRLLDRFIR